MHAHLIISPYLDTSCIPNECQVPSADVSHTTILQFGIDDARALTEAASKRPLIRAHRTFVIFAGTMTREAQNALLKLFEEPPAGGVFYLMVPHESVLIPTLRSRLILMQSVAPLRELSLGEDFLKRSYAERLEQIAALQKEKRSAEMQSIADAIAAIAARDPKRFDERALRAASFVASNIRITGGSRKMLLEHLALALPSGVS